MGQVGIGEIPAQNMEHLQLRVVAQIQLLQGTSAPGKIGQRRYVLQIQLRECGVEAVQMLQRGHAAQIQRFQRRIFVAGEGSQCREILQHQGGEVVFAAVEAFQVPEILQPVQLFDALLAKIHGRDCVQLLLGEESVAITVLFPHPLQKCRVGEGFFGQGNGRGVRGGSHGGCGAQREQKSGGVSP